MHSELTVSNDLLGDPAALQQRLDSDGYLYLQKVMDKALLEDLRYQILEIFAEKNWLLAGTDPMAAITNAVPTVEGEEAFLEVYDEVQKLESFHSLAHDAKLMSVMRQVVGSSVFPHPLAVARLVFPDNIECTTPPHQDYPNNQGTQHLYASWIPLGDCPQELGGLSILESSPRLGLLPLQFSLGAGGRQALLPEEAGNLRWLSTDFKCGDILVFGSLTVHRSLPNLTANRFRLSVDFRYQAEGAALTKAALEPHFGRLSWEEIYSAWNNKELQYYWEYKNFEIVPWDKKRHELPASHLEEAVKKSRKYKQRRQQARANRTID